MAKASKTNADFKKQAQIVCGKKLSFPQLQEIKSNILGVCKFILQKSHSKIIEKPC